MPRKGWGTFAAVLCLAVSTAHAQGAAVPELELDRFELNPSGVGSLVVGAAELLPHQGFRLTGLAHYARDPLLVFRNDVLLGARVSDRVQFHVAAAYAIHSRVEFSIQLPVIAFQAGEDFSSLGLSPPARTGLGAPDVAGRFALLRTQDGAPLELAAQVGFRWARDGAVVPKLLVSRRISRWMGTLEGGALLRSSTVLGDATVGSEVRLAGAVIVRMWERVRAEVSLRSALSLTRQPRSLELLLGGRYNFRNAFSLFVLAGPGLGGGPGTPSFRVLIGGAVE